MSEISDAPTTALLQEWHAGHDEALGAILTKHLEFIRAVVRKRTQPVLQRKFDLDDFVQDTVQQILTYAPPFLARDGDHFRTLLARMVLSSISENWRYIRAKRRDMCREAPLPPDSVLILNAARPSEIASRQEEEAAVRLALELAPPDDRFLILLRDWDALPYDEIGAKLGVAPDTARMRYKRAVERLGKTVRELTEGGVMNPEQEDPECPSPEPPTPT